MPAIAALTINDGQATPAPKTFTVVGTTGAKATWADKTSGVPVGYTRVTREVREAKSKDGAHSVLYGWEFPTTALVNGVLTRVRVSSAQVRINFAQDSTDAERKDINALVANALLEAGHKVANANIEPHY